MATIGRRLAAQKYEFVVWLLPGKESARRRKKSPREAGNAACCAGMSPEGSTGGDVQAVVGAFCGPLCGAGDRTRPHRAPSGDAQNFWSMPSAIVVVSGRAAATGSFSTLAQ